MSTKVITLVPTVGSIIVARPQPGRDGNEKMVQVSPEKGKPFEFTADEVADINRLSPGALRKAVNEVTSDDDDDDAGPSLAGIAEPADEPEPEPAPKPAKAKKAAADDLGGL